MIYRITTESGSVYSLDTLARTMTRLPGGEAESLEGDFTPMPYESLWRPPEVGQEMVVFWEDGDHWPKMRVTTPVVGMETVPYDAA